MNNILKINDVFTYENNDYLAIDKEEYNGSVYFFVNKLISEDEPGKEFFIFKVNGDSAIIESDKGTLDKLYAIFSERFNKRLETISNNN